MNTAVPVDIRAMPRAGMPPLPRGSWAPLPRARSGHGRDRIEAMFDNNVTAPELSAYVADLMVPIVTA